MLSLQGAQRDVAIRFIKRKECEEEDDIGLDYIQGSLFAKEYCNGAQTGKEKQKGADYTVISPMIIA